MHVILYKYLGEKNRVDKSSFLSLVLDTTGDFKASVSILNPTLLLKLPLDPAYLLTDENEDEVLGMEEPGRRGRRAGKSS